MINDVIMRLNTFGYIPNESDQWLINLMIRKVENYIKDICNVRAIPDGLREIAIDMICAEFMMGKKAMGQIPTMNFDPIVKSISEGDTSVSYEGETSAEQRFDALMLKLAHPETSVFVKYRKLVW